MRAAIIAWDPVRGVSVLSAGPNTFYMEPSNGDMQKCAEQYVKLERFLIALSPVLPPANLEAKSGPLPEITEEQLTRAQRFDIPRAAKGSGVGKATKPTLEEIDKLLEDL